MEFTVKLNERKSLA